MFWNLNPLSPCQQSCSPYKHFRYYRLKLHCPTIKQKFQLFEGKKLKRKHFYLHFSQSFGFTFDSGLNCVYQLPLYGKWGSLLTCFSLNRLKSSKKKDIFFFFKVRLIRHNNLFFSSNRGYHFSLHRVIWVPLYDHFCIFWVTLQQKKMIPCLVFHL